MTWIGHLKCRLHVISSPWRFEFHLHIISSPWISQEENRHLIAQLQIEATRSPGGGSAQPDLGILAVPKTKVWKSMDRSQWINVELKFNNKMNIDRFLWILFLQDESREMALLKKKLELTSQEKASLERELKLQVGIKTIILA